MLPVGNRPILEHVIAALHAADVRDITLVVGYKAETIQAYFQDGEKFSVRLRYAHQPRRDGTADAFRRGLEAGPKDEDVLLVPGDNYVDHHVIRRFLRAAGSSDALLYTTSDNPEQYGVLALSDGQVASIEEKPPWPGRRTISTGIARVAGARAARVRAHAKDAETGLTSFLNELSGTRPGLLAVPLEGAWFDVDHPENLLGANALHLAEEKGKVEGVVEAGASLVGEVRVGQGSRIRSGCYIVGPVTIGDGCEIGPHTVVYGPASLGDNVTVGPFTELLDCVVMANCRVASGCTLHHAVLDRGVILAPGVSVDRAHAIAGPGFGAVVGDGTILGNNVVVQPGSVLGINVRVAPHKTVGGMADGARVV